MKDEGNDEDKYGCKPDEVGRWKRQRVQIGSSALEEAKLSWKLDDSQNPEVCFECGWKEGFQNGWNAANKHYARALPFAPPPPSGMVFSKAPPPGAKVPPQDHLLMVSTTSQYGYPVLTAKQASYSSHIGDEDAICQEP